MKIAASSLNGVFAVDKPSGVTSAFIVNKLKYLIRNALSSKKETKDQTPLSSELPKQHKKSKNSLPTIKIGHGGTLDPLATGVLVIGVGKGTKLLGQLLDCEKEYVVTGSLGTATDTYDSQGKVMETAEYAHITSELIQSHLEKFKGAIMQKPPIYSALKRQGKPLYEYARENLPLPEIEARPVTIHELELLQFTTTPSSTPTTTEITTPSLSSSTSTDETNSTPSITSPSFSLRVKCSKGTYIRSLVHDLGQSLGSCAHVTQLRRTQQGEWNELLALNLEDLTLEKIEKAIR